MNSDAQGRTVKYDAIIFDLFGTLADNFGGGYVAALRAGGVLSELSPGWIKGRCG